MVVGNVIMALISTDQLEYQDLDLIKSPICYNLRINKEVVKLNA